MKPADQTFVCPACSADFYVQSNLDQHVCARVAPRQGAFHSDNVVTDTGAEWVGRPIPGNGWRPQEAPPRPTTTQPPPPTADAATGTFSYTRTGG